MRARSRCLWVWAALACLFASGSNACAHSSLKQWGDFASGLMHPVTTPTHILIIVGLGLLAGRRVPLNLQTPMALFVALSGAALILTTTGWVKAVHPPILLGIALAIGVFLALGDGPPPLASYALFAIAALAMGLDSGVESGSRETVIKTLLGTWIALSVLVFDVAVWTSMGKGTRRLKIGIQIAGSWIIAISILALAFSFRR